MATVPLSGTNIRLISGVPFSNDYKNTRWFKDKTTQTNYFLGKTLIHGVTQANFQRIEGKHFIAINKSIDELWQTNYIMFQNANYIDKWFYAFVTKLEYVQRNTTYVHFEIDVMQTWRFDFTFKPSFVVREHCKLWNADGSPVVNTIDEGLDYGSAYDNVQSEQYQPYKGMRFMIIVSKTPLEKTDNKVEGTIAGVPQPLSFYMIPLDYDFTSPNIVLDGIVHPITPAVRMLKELYYSESAINNIVSIYLTESTGLALEIKRTTGYPTQLIATNNGVGQTLTVVTIANQPELALVKITKKQAFYSHRDVVHTDKYHGFRSVKESKLLMYPYCVTILDDLKGNRVEIKNEHIKGKELAITTRGSIGTSNHTTYSVQEYNMTDTVAHESLIANETAIVNNNPTDIPIINDMLAAFLQGNKNSVQNQRNAVMFNGVMDAISATTQGVASATMQDPLGAASGFGVFNAGVSATKGAGNTVLQLQAIEAKQRDIGNIPPQIAKMGSNISYDVGNGLNGLFIVKKQIKPEYQKKLEDFFNMFGYKVNEVKIPNYQTRKYWNYVQTLGCYLTGTMGAEDLQALKNIFDAGITLWHTDDVGNYALENEVI